MSDSFDIRFAMQATSLASEAQKLMSAQKRRCGEYREVSVERVVEVLLNREPNGFAGGCRRRDASDHRSTCL